MVNFIYDLKKNSPQMGNTREFHQNFKESLQKTHRLMHNEIEQTLV